MYDMIDSAGDVISEMLEIALRPLEVSTGAVAIVRRSDGVVMAYRAGMATTPAQERAERAAGAWADKRRRAA